jgi:hypothetical protein
MNFLQGTVLVGIGMVAGAALYHHHSSVKDRAKEAGEALVDEAHDDYREKFLAMVEKAA